VDPDAITPVVHYIRREEKERTLQLHQTLVHVTETMIELFPMLGIFGTVWGFAGVRDFSSQALLTQFAVAVNTTLFGLVYFILFRLLYALLIQAKVAALEQYSEQFQEFLSALERRSSEGSVLPDEEGTSDWDPRRKP
jgi:biopolymer transport protein ExbB/TolQ